MPMTVRRRRFPDLRGSGEQIALIDYSVWMALADVVVQFVGLTEVLPAHRTRRFPVVLRWRGVRGWCLGHTVPA